MRCFAFALSLFAAAACTRAPSQLVLHLESDLPLAELDKFSVRAIAGSGAIDVADFPRTGTPQTLGIIAPGGNAEESITLKISGSGRSTELTVERRVTNFARGRTLHLYACLSERCASSSSTCTPSFALSAELGHADLETFSDENPPADFAAGCVPRIEPQPDRDAGTNEDADPPIFEDASEGEADAVADATANDDAAMDAGLDSGAPEECVDWWDEDWRRRRRIDIDNSDLTTPLGDFPLLVVLPVEVTGSAEIDDEGRDVRFIAADQITRLDYELEEFEAGEPGYAWVRLPVLPDNTSDISIYLYYGNQNASGAQNPAGLWRSGYQAVWHLNQPVTGTGPQLDSTGSNHDAEPQGNMPANARRPAKIGDGLRFDGNNDCLTVAEGSIDIRNRAFAIEFWASFESLAADGSVVGFHSNSDDRQTVFLRATTDGRLIFGYWNDDLVTSPGTIIANTWYYLAFQYEPPDRSRIFLDGAELASGTHGPFEGMNPEISIGRWRELGDPNYVNATVDELRVSFVAQNDEWYRAQYRSMNNDSFAVIDLLEETCE